jgi:hypothetical protein
LTFTPPARKLLPGRGRTSDAHNGFAASQIRDVNERVVERGENVRNAKDQFAFTNLGSKGNIFFGCLRGGLFL